MVRGRHCLEMMKVQDDDWRVLNQIQAYWRSHRRKPEWTEITSNSVEIMPFKGQNHEASRKNEAIRGR